MSYKNLSVPACINIEADKLADLQYKHALNEHFVQMPHLPAQVISFVSPQYRLTNNTLDKLVCTHRDSAAESTLSKTWDLPPSILQTID